MLYKSVHTWLRPGYRVTGWVRVGGHRHFNIKINYYQSNIKQKFCSELYTEYLQITIWNEFKYEEPSSLPSSGTNVIRYNDELNANFDIVTLVETSGKHSVTTLCSDMNKLVIDIKCVIKKCHCRHISSEILEKICWVIFRVNTEWSKFSSLTRYLRARDFTKNQLFRYKDDIKPS